VSEAGQPCDFAALLTNCNPMDRSERRSRLAIFAMAWLIGGGLLAAPAEIGDAIRAPVRDLLAPGQVIVVEVFSMVREQLTAWRCGPDADELTSLRTERDQWRDRFLELQVRQARAEEAQPTIMPLAVHPTEPLIVSDVVEARVLGSERDPLRTRVSRLLNRGRSDGVAVDDIVLADALPLLDLGTDARIEPDMPVVSGGSAVGRIRQCGRWTSTLQPVADPEFRAFVQIVRPAADQPLAGAEGVLAGNGDGTCRMELVDVTQPVSIGDFVYGRLADFDAAPPCYGQITAAEVRDGAEFWTIAVTPVARWDALQTVQILRELPNPVRISGRDATERQAVRAE
jgi:cell shape-determining protein MreC